MAFPSSIPSYTGFTSTHTLQQDSHASQHNLEQSDIAAIATKVGTGASTPSNNTVLRGNGAGTSGYDTVHAATDISGVLGVSNGGTGTTTSTGTGSVVLSSSPNITGTVTGSATYSTPTLTQPTISDFTNAQHNHSNAVNGGVLGNAVVTSQMAKLTIVGADGTQLNPIPISETDIPSSSSTFTLATASFVLITFAVESFQLNGTGGGVDARCFLNIDGSDVSSIYGQNNNNAQNIYTGGAKIYRATLSSGSHTIKLRAIAAVSTTAVANNPGWWGIVVSQ